MIDNEDIHEFLDPHCPGCSLTFLYEWHLEQGEYMIDCGMELEARLHAEAANVIGMMAELLGAVQAKADEVQGEGESQ